MFNRLSVESVNSEEFYGDSNEDIPENDDNFVIKTKDKMSRLENCSCKSKEDLANLHNILCNSGVFEESNQDEIGFAKMVSSVSTAMTKLLWQANKLVDFCEGTVGSGQACVIGNSVDKIGKLYQEILDFAHRQNVYISERSILNSNSAPCLSTKASRNKRQYEEESKNYAYDADDDGILLTLK